MEKDLSNKVSRHQTSYNGRQGSEQGKDFPPVPESDGGQRHEGISSAKHKYLRKKAGGRDAGSASEDHNPPDKESRKAQSERPSSQKSLTPSKAASKAPADFQQRSSAASESGKAM